MDPDVNPLTLYARRKKKIEHFKDVELLRKAAGTCFGETALIYPNMKRTASAYSLSETILFSIEKSHFLSVFGKSFTRSELEKKNFILSHIPGFQEMATKFDYYYRKIVPVVCNL